MGAKRIILRLKDIARLEGYRYFYKHTLGFDVVLSTDELAAEEIIGTRFASTAHSRSRVPSRTDAYSSGACRIREEGELTAEHAGGAATCRTGVLIVAVARKDAVLRPARGRPSSKSTIRST